MPNYLGIDFSDEGWKDQSISKLDLQVAEIKDLKQSTA
jgi:hypothetical protein